MELRQVRYFLAVADAGSFSAGARRAFVTQPTLSAAIASLEAELGAKLFERRARGIALTPQGERALDHARRILREAETLKSAGRAATLAKPLRIGLLPTLPPTLVIETLGRLASIDPNHRWSSEDATLGQLHQRLLAGRYDTVLTSLGRAQRGIRQLELARDTQALAVARSERPTKLVTPAFLQRRPLIVRTHCEMLHQASRILDDWHVRPLVVARTDSDTRALAMVAAGVGACLMPDSFGHKEAVFLRVDGVALSRRLGLEWVRGAEAVDRIIAALR